ncbi:MAG: hypothetical protein H6635_06940 [Anaerolineales bacterium]|nr:hypothetical protein [Anaerolineales bacterium]MCB9145088.1 hypothetical protein [Anaerolineales bacterium]
MSRQTSTAIILLFLFIAGMAIIQFSTPNLPDNDGYYHIKMAWLMRTEGLKPAFTWLPMSILNQADYYDHHFLYHVALIPFTFGDLLVGAKWAAVIFSALAFLAIWYLLNRQKIPFAWLWSLALLGISEAFLYRMSISRAQSLSLGMMALGLAWMFEGKYKQLAVLSFLYVWMYNAFPLMFALAGLYSLAILLVERRLEYRPLLWVGAGILAGLIINPYFPNNLIFTYHHFIEKLQLQDSIRVGNEWYPYETSQLFDNSPLAMLLFASGIFALGLSGRKMDTRTATILLVALLFGAMMFEARRFVEYFPPFALIFAAFAWGAVVKFEGDFMVKLSGKAQTYIPQFVLVLLVIAGMFKSIPAVQNQMAQSKPLDLYANASAWLAMNTEYGELVFQTDWDDFPRLFYYNTRNTYLIGLDPTYLQIYDPALYKEWVSITRGAVENPSGVIFSRFGARLIHTDLNHEKFIAQAEKDPNLKEVYRDGQSVLFEVIEP